MGASCGGVTNPQVRHPQEQEWLLGTEGQRRGRDMQLWLCALDGASAPPPTLAAGGAFGRGSGLEGVLGRGPHHGLSDIIGGDPREPAVTHPCWHRRVTALTGWPPTH